VQLHREDVLDGALALLDDEGLDGLTMRRLAKRLGVQAGAIYWHFASKQALLDAMADRLVEDVGEPLPSGSWEDQVSILAYRLRQALLSHRDGARVMAGTYVADPNTSRATKVTINLLHDAGFTPEKAGWITFALTHYVLGHTIEEQALAALLADRTWKDKVASYRQDEEPHIARAIDAVIDSDPTERFTYGLRIFIDGISHQIRDL
jgi:TetR/AcrR family tetracycline transcriptional repressor